MGTKRRKVQVRQTGISARAIEAWKIGDGATLDRELGVDLHQSSPLDVTSPEPPSWMPPDPDAPVLMGRGAWARAWALRQQLIALAGPPGRGGRPAKRR